MKIKVLFLTLAATLANNTYAQQNAMPNAWLKMVDKLKSLKSISYNYHREINNTKDNYHSEMGGKCYMVFNEADLQTVARFRLETDGYISIYNGTEVFQLNKPDKTFSLTEQAEPKTFSNYSFFYNSLQTLRYAANKIAVTDSILKSQKDTLVNNKAYKMVQLAMHKNSLSYGGSAMHFTKDVTIFYKVIIDPATWLPYQVLEHNSLDKDGYNTATTFTNIDLKPDEPEEYSWFYSTYQNEYRPEKPEKNTPMIAAGASIPYDWALPVFNTKNEPVFNGEAMKGKLVLIDFWIKNCGPCMESFPLLKQLQAKYGSDKFELISINAYDKKQDIDFFYKREKPNYKMLYNGSAFAKSLGVFAYPSVILIDKSGNVIYAANGFEHEKIEALIKANL